MTVERLMYVFVITRNGWGNVYGFPSLRMARLHPIPQLDDVYATAPDNLLEQYGKGHVNELLRFAEGRDRARLVDAFETWRNGGSLSQAAKLLLWEKVTEAAAVPPTDPTDIVSIIKEDRLFREDRVLRSFGTEERSSTTAQQRTTRKESKMAEARRRINENRVITVVGKADGGGNPKRPNSKAAERFEFYKDGMTVKEAKEAGLLAVDITYDYDHGYISLSDEPEPTEATATEGEAEGEAAPKKKRGRKKVEAAEAATEAAA